MQQSPETILKITQNFAAPGLIFDKSIQAGPDEMLYFLHDQENHKFILWARDYTLALLA